MLEDYRLLPSTKDFVGIQGFQYEQFCSELVIETYMLEIQNI